MTDIHSIVSAVWNYEVSIQSARSSGPGGQNVNKRETKMQLFWKIGESATLPEPYKSRCITLHKHNISSDGMLRLDASVHRTQDSNKQLLYKKLSSVIKSAFKEQKIRITTKVPRRENEKRLDDKKKKSVIRANKRVVWDE